MKLIVPGLALLMSFGFVFGFVTTPDPVYAEGIVPCGDAGDDHLECSLCDLQNLAVNFVKFMITFATMVATLLFVNAGILYVFSPANPGNIAKAHSIFKSTLIGFILILAAWLIISLIMSTLYKGDTFGAWNNILCTEGPTSVSRNENVSGGPLVVTSNNDNEAIVDPTSETIGDFVTGGDDNVPTGGDSDRGGSTRSA